MTQFSDRTLGQLTQGDSDLVVLNLGAGRQSVALLALACADLIPKPDLVIHADTGHERKETYRYIEQIVGPRCEAAGLRFEIVSNGNIRLDTLRSVLEGTRIANAPYFVDKGNGKKGKLNRLCTSEYKIVPITRAIRAHLGIKPGHRVHTKAHPLHVEQWIGIATEEAKRATNNSGLVWSSLRYPLIELGISTQDCIQIIQDLGWPVPVKSACVACPFRSNTSWALLKLESPDAWADAVDFDKRLRDPHGEGRLNGRVKGASFAAYVHPSCKPLSELDLSGVDLDAGESFGGEC